MLIVIQLSLKQIILLRKVESKPWKADLTHKIVSENIALNIKNYFFLILIVHFSFQNDIPDNFKFAANISSYEHNIKKNFLKN